MLPSSGSTGSSHSSTQPHARLPPVRLPQASYLQTFPWKRWAQALRPLSSKKAPVTWLALCRVTARGHLSPWKASAPILLCQVSACCDAGGCHPRCWRPAGLCLVLLFEVLRERSNSETEKVPFNIVLHIPNITLTKLGSFTYFITCLFTSYYVLSIFLCQ